MDIAVVGTGYVGLVAGACFAETGNNVICVDQDASKIAALKDGQIPIYEPGLETLVTKGVRAERLHFTTDLADAFPRSEIVFLAVGTPPRADGTPDLRYVKAAAEEIGQQMQGPTIVVNKSTVPVGSHKEVAAWISAQTQHPVEVVSNPEFLKEGSAVDDFLKPDRVVIGTNKKSAYEKLRSLYAPFVRQGNPIYWMDPISAELAKYACNTFLATRISFMNEMSWVCEKMGGDVEKVRQVMASDQRIGRKFLYAGVGYGGSCFPKDVKALIHKAQSEGIRLGIAEAAEETNAIQKEHFVHKIQHRFGSDNLKGKVFGFWGLAFKPNTDDIREAPALVVAEGLTRLGAKVKAFDPVAMKNTEASLGDKIQYCASAYEAADGVDALLLLTEWNEFRHPDWKRLKKTMRQALLFDGRNIYPPAEVSSAGFEYVGVGRAAEIFN